MSDNSLRDWLSLTHTKGLGPAMLRKLQEALGSIDNILGASNGKLRQAGLPDKVIDAMRNVNTDNIDADIQWRDEAADRFIITRESTHYPALLKQIADPPLVLYVRGDPEVLNTPQVAIVGSRKPTHSAEGHAFEMANQLAQRGLTVTSGLALGVDACAHRGALSADGFTVAVTATGLDRVYPAKNQQLAQQIAEHSAIISEFPIGTNPMAGHFPRRNRIISGLCYGTLVVEATLKSGTLTTAAHATSQAREVFAIPGNIDNLQSRGCHALLRQGATLTETVDDILEVLAPLLPRQLPANISSPTLDTTPAKTAQTTQKTTAKTIDRVAAKPSDSGEKQILKSMSYDPISMDELIERTGLDVANITQLTVELELRGHIKRDPAGNFVKTAPSDSIA